MAGLWECRNIWIKISMFVRVSPKEIFIWIHDSAKPLQWEWISSNLFERLNRTKGRRKHGPLCLADCLLLWNWGWDHQLPSLVGSRKQTDVTPGFPGLSLQKSHETSQPPLSCESMAHKFFFHILLTFLREHWQLAPYPHILTASSSHISCELSHLNVNKNLSFLLLIYLLLLYVKV